MDDMSIDASLKKREGEIKDTILHSQAVCNSVEIMIRGQMDDISIIVSLKERRRNKGYNSALTGCVK